MKKIGLFFALIIMCIMFTASESAAYYSTSGKCGDNLTWSYNSSTKVLNISGEGEMYDFEQLSAPWDSYSRYVKTINLPEGLKSIGEYAFNICTNITTITIPSSVTRIGDSAFMNCSSLVNVYAESVESWLGITFEGTYSNPMYNASNLYLNNAIATNVVIPDTVTTIDKYAFYNCSSLTDITVPDGVTSIGYYAFYNCSNLANVNIESVESWLDITFESTYSNPMCYADNLYLNDVLVTDIVIPDGVTTIGAYAFYNCSTLTKITIPDSVTTIGAYAFYYCSGLKSVTFLDCVATIGPSAFSNCSKLVDVYAKSIEGWLSLTFTDTYSSPMYYADNLYFGGALTTDIDIPDGVATIGEYAFYNCLSLTDITIPDSVTTIGGYAFYNCLGLTDVTIPSSVTTIDGYTFYNCSNLKSIAIPKETILISEFAFEGCSNLTNLIIDNENQWYSSIEGVLFNKDKTILISYHSKSGADYTVPDGVKVIGKYAFNNSRNLDNINLPNGLTTIQEHAFNECRWLEKVNIPNSVNCIEQNIFNNCYDVQVYYDGTESEWATIDISYNNIALTNAVKHFVDSNEIILSGSHSSGMKYYLYDDGTLLLNSEYSYEISMPSHSQASSYPWHNYRNSIKKIVFNGIYKNIGSYAFYNCTALESVELSPFMKNLEIGDYAFYGCGSLGSMFVLNYWGSSSITIGKWAFAYCSTMTEISLPNSQISDYAFYQCANLKTINLYLGYINTYRFAPTDTSFLGVVADVMYPYASIEYDTVKKDYGGSLTWKESFYGPCGPKSTWKYNKDKKELIISGEGYIFSKSAGDGMPWYKFCEEIVNIKIEEGITRIPSYAFEYCENVETVELPNTLIYFCTNAFNDCGKLNNILLPASIEMFGHTEFHRCESLTDLYYLGTEEEWRKIEGSSEVKKFTGTELKIHFIIEHYKEPTCIENGYEKYYQFDKTDVYDTLYDLDRKAISAPVAIPATGIHTYASEVTKVATHLEEGTLTYTCECGDSYTKPIAKLKGHTYASEVTKEPTHIEYGETTYTCECGDSYTEPIAKLEGHTYTSEVTKEATHLEEGETTYICECGDSYTEPIAKLEVHTYTSEVTKESTHLEEGEKTYTCECGDSYTEPIAKLEGHTYISEVTKEATHIEEGVLTYTCECGDSYTESIEKIEEHTYIANMIDPTCSEKGYTLNVCECGDSYISDYVGMIAHSYAYSIIKLSTHISEGLGRYTCSECGDHYDEPIAKTKEHSYISTTVDSTCTEQGYTLNECECGDSYKTNYLAKTDHNDSNSDGVCDDCGHDLTEICSCNCHKGGIAGFFFKLILFFQKIFKTNQICEGCGIRHY